MFWKTRENEQLLDEYFDTKLETYKHKQLGDYIIKYKTIIPKENDVLQLLRASEPVSSMFRYDSSEIIFFDGEKDISGMKIFGQTTGNKWGKSNQKVEVSTARPNVLVHEMGHIIDRYSDGENSLPWSRRSDFDFVITKYRDILYTNSELNIPEKYYYSEDAEIFARLFEEYLIHEHSELAIANKEVIRPIDLISKEVYESNEDIKLYFDKVTQNLHLNRLGLWKTPEPLQPEDLPSNKEKEVLY